MDDRHFDLQTQIYTEKHWSRLIPGAQFPGAIRFGSNSFVTSIREALLCSSHFAFPLCCVAAATEL
jgi:hypothetical protein